MQRLRLGALITSATLLACSGSNKEANDQDSAAPMVPVALSSASAPRDTAGMEATMPFRWPSPGVVAVHEKALKRGTTSTVSYEVHLCPLPGGETLVRRRNTKLESVGGTSTSSPEFEGALAQIEAMLQLAPDLRLDTYGDVLEVIGLREAAAKVSKLYGDPQVSTMMNHLMSNPQVLGALEAKAASVWGNWVSMWTTFEPEGPARQTLEVEPLELAGENADYVRMEIERVERVDGHLRLRIVQEEGTSTLRPILRELIKQILPPDLADAKKEIDKVMRDAVIKRDSTLEVLTDPRTLQPRTASSYSSLTIEVPGKISRSREERHDYRFDFETPAGRHPDCD